MKAAQGSDAALYAHVDMHIDLPILWRIIDLFRFALLSQFNSHLAVHFI